MKDRVATYPGRVKLVPVDASQNTYTMTMADEPTEQGTPLNKANLLSDETARKIGLEGNPTVNDALNAVAGNVGDIKFTVRTDLGDRWILCNGGHVRAEEYPELAEVLPATDVHIDNHTPISNDSDVLRSISEHNGTWVAVGQKITGRFYVSHDGVNWTSHLPSEYGLGMNYSKIHAVRYVGGYFAILGLNAYQSYDGTAYLLVSSDGDNWTAVSPNSNEYGVIVDIDYDGQTYAAIVWEYSVDYEGLNELKAIKSTNILSASWSRGASHITATTGWDTYHHWLRANGLNDWVLGGYANAFYTASDPIVTWTVHTRNTSVYFPSLIDGTWYSVTGSSANSTIAKSTDLKSETWVELHTTGLDGNPGTTTYRICKAKDKYFTLRENGLFASDDLMSWTSYKPFDYASNIATLADINVNSNDSIMIAGGHVPSGGNLENPATWAAFTNVITLPTISVDKAYAYINGGETA